MAIRQLAPKRHTESPITTVPLPSLFMALENNLNASDASAQGKQGQNDVKKSSESANPAVVNLPQMNLKEIIEAKIAATMDEGVANKKSEFKHEVVREGDGYVTYITLRENDNDNGSSIENERRAFCVTGATEDDARQRLQDSIEGIMSEELREELNRLRDQRLTPPVKEN